MRLQYDTPVEVTEKQYNAVRQKCGGIIAAKKDGNKYYIKLWLTKYEGFVVRVLKENE